MGPTVLFLVFLFSRKNGETKSSVAEKRFSKMHHTTQESADKNSLWEGNLTDAISCSLLCISLPDCNRFVFSNSKQYCGLHSEMKILTRSYQKTLYQVWQMKKISSPPKQTAKRKMCLKGKRPSLKSVRRFYKIVPVGDKVMYIRQRCIKKTWQEALDDCRCLGGTLLQTKTIKQHRAVSRFCEESLEKGRLFWIGVMPNYLTRKYVWIDGSAVKRSHWHGRNHPISRRKCVVLRYYGNGRWEWGMKWCRQPSYFLCQYTLEKNSLPLL